MQHYSKLQVWQRSHSLVLSVYKMTAIFPSSEKFGLTSQLRRAASSVPTNIAEGSKRITGQDFARFLNIAVGSLSEIEYLLVLSRDLGYLAASVVAAPLKEVSEILRMLKALRQTVTQ